MSAESAQSLEKRRAHEESNIRLPTGQTRIVNGPSRTAGLGVFSRAYCGSGWVLYTYTYFTYS